MEEYEIDGLDDLEMMNTPVEDIETDDVTLMFIGVDSSGSMRPFADVMKEELVNFKNAIMGSDEKENILVARANFNSNLEIGGYVKIDDFNLDYKPRGATILYDTIVEGAKRLIEYMELLKSQKARVKAVFVIFSDGEDTTSKKECYDAKLAIMDLTKREVVTAFISFGDDASKEADGLLFGNVLEIGQSETELRDAFETLGKSVIEQAKTEKNKLEDFFEQ